MKNKIIIFLVLASFSGFGQGIYRTLPNVTNTADSMKPVSTVQKAAIVQKLQTVSTVSALQAFTDATIATFDGSQWNKVAGNVASNGGAFAGTIINVNTSFYWQRKFQFADSRFFGVIPDNATDNSITLQLYINYCITNKYEIVLPNGIILYNSQIVINATNGCNIRGQGREQTKLRFNSSAAGVSGIKIIGAFNNGAYNISDVLIGNEVAQTGTGIEFNKCQNINMKNVTIFHYELGMKLIDVNASNFENVTIQYCKKGLTGDIATITPPNAITFTNCYFVSNDTKAVYLNLLHSVVFNNCSFEDNGTQGLANSGAFEGNFSPINGLNAVTFNSCYFEHTGGDYDIKIQNNASGVSSINNCTFNRIDVNKYAINNILLISDPTSTNQFVNTLKISGNGFFSANTYVPSLTKRTISFSSNAVYKGFNIVENNNVFTSNLDIFQIPLSYLQESSNTRLQASLRMGGDASIGHNYNIASVTRQGAGNYLITFANPLPHYPIISITPISAYANCFVFAESLTSITVFTQNAAGTSVDAAISIAVH